MSPFALRLPLLSGGIAFFFASLALAADPPATAGPPPAAASPAAATDQASTPAVAAAPAASGPERAKRVILILKADCPECDTLLQRLERPRGTFAAMKKSGWTIGTTHDQHLQIVQAEEIPDQIAAWDIKVFPMVICLEKGEIVRSFRSGCSTPLDGYTFGWLMKGVSERPLPPQPQPVTVQSNWSYPLRGNHWSVEGDWRPSHARAVWHLRGPNHSHLFPSSWPIESWSLEELLSLHDDLHESNRPRALMTISQR